MNKIINIGLTALFACFVAACENDIDNYDAPNGGVYGTIYDKETNEPVPMPVPGSSGVMSNNPPSPHSIFHVKNHRNYTRTNNRS